MTQACSIINGHVHSPFFLFVRASGRLSDAELLGLLGLHDFVRHPFLTDLSKPHIFLTEDEDWIHIADDWHYSLWHKGAHDIADALHEGLPDVPLFACSIGDIDRSFDFTYYDLGRMIRRFVVEDRHHASSQRTVVEDFGEPLPDEIDVAYIDDEQEYVLSLATNPGVRIDHHLEQIRCYTKPPS